MLSALATEPPRRKAGAVRRRLSHGPRFPATWATVVAVLLPKKTHAPTRIDKLRDIWLTTIGSRVIGAFTREHVFAPLDERLVFAQGGFRAARMTLEHCQALRLLTEQARMRARKSATRRTARSRSSPR